MSNLVCVYAGSFDPPTIGHDWMIRKGAAKYDRFIVAVGVNPAKTPMFTIEERMVLLRAMLADLPNVEVTSFENKFLVHYAREVGAKYILRGMRNVTDYLYEVSMIDFNRNIDPLIETEFMMAPPSFSVVSSSVVKGNIGPEHWEEVIRPYVTEPVYNLLLEKVHARAKRIVS